MAGAQAGGGRSSGSGGGGSSGSGTRVVPMLLLVLLLLACCCWSCTAASAPTAAANATADGRAVFDYLRASNHSLFAAMLREVGLTPGSIPRGARFSVALPPDASLRALANNMGFASFDAFLKRKTLVDLVVAYQVVPGYLVERGFKLPAASPTVALTADANNVQLWFAKPQQQGQGQQGQQGQQQQAYVRDAQGNAVDVVGPPVVITSAAGILVSFVPTAAVLMSRAFFTTGEKALATYTQWSSAYQFYRSTGLPPAELARDALFFVPNNAAFRAAAPLLDALAGNSSGSQAARREVVLYHTHAGALTIPQQLKTGPLATRLPGHSLKVDASGSFKLGDRTVPIVTLTPEVGADAGVVLFNVFVGTSVFNGVDGLLLPDTPSIRAARARLPASAAAGYVKAATAKNATAAAATTTKPTAAAAAPAKPAATAAAPAGRRRRGRSLLGAPVLEGVPNSLAATSTTSAIRAAAEGRQPVEFATAAGQYSASRASCFNCEAWRQTYNFAPAGRR